MVGIGKVLGRSVALLVTGAVGTSALPKAAFAAKLPEAPRLERQVPTAQTPELLAQRIIETGAPTTFSPVPAGRIILDGSTHNVYQHADSQGRMRTFVQIGAMFQEVQNPTYSTNNDTTHETLYGIGRPVNPRQFIVSLGINLNIQIGGGRQPERQGRIERRQQPTYERRVYQPSLHELPNHVIPGISQAHNNGFDYIIDSCHRNSQGYTILRMRSISHANSQQSPGGQERVAFDKHGNYYRVDEHGNLTQLSENYGQHFQLSNLVQRQSSTQGVEGEGTDPTQGTGRIPGTRIIAQSPSQDKLDAFAQL
jgi:hypothetical protein